MLLMSDSGIEISKELVDYNVDKIKHVFILLTPFHKRVINQLWGDLLNSKTTLVLFGRYVEVDEFQCTKFSIGEVNISKKEYSIYSIYSIIDLRKKIKQIKSAIDKVVRTYNLNSGLNVYIGSEKDIYTQFLISTLFKGNQRNSLIAFEEGVGYYKKQNQIKTYFLKIVYSILTKILFGKKINYVYTLGIDKRIEAVYARLPNLLPYRNPNTVYIQMSTFTINTKSNYLNTKLSQSNSASILILSYPSQDNFGNDDIKVSCIEEILRKIDNFLVHIKPHPREDINYIHSFSCRNPEVIILNKNITAEDLDYTRYAFIINFYSSVVIDLLACGYPSNRIITIGFRKNTNIAFFKETKYIYINEIKDLNFEN